MCERWNYLHLTYFPLINNSMSLVLFGHSLVWDVLWYLIFLSLRIYIIFSMHYTINIVIWQRSCDVFYSILFLFFLPQSLHLFLLPASLIIWFIFLGSVFPTAIPSFPNIYLIFKAFLISSFVIPNLEKNNLKGLYILLSDQQLKLLSFILNVRL